MLLFCDGMDHYSDDILLKKWDAKATAPFGDIFLSPGSGRFGTNCVAATDSFRYLMKAVPARSTLIAGVAFNPSGGLASAPAVIFGFYQDTIKLAQLVISNAHEIELHAGQGAGTQNFGQIAYGTVPIRAGLFQYLEMKVTFHPTGGSAEIRLNGDTVIQEMDIDTGGAWTNQSLTYANACFLCGVSTWIRTDYPAYILFDDFYLNDNLGSHCNDFLGDVTMEEQMPISDGYHKEWIRSSGYDGYALVDDPYDAVDMVTYVYERTVGVRDTYNFPSLVTEYGDVYAVAMNYYTQKVDSGQRKISSLARYAGDDIIGYEMNLGWGYAFYQSVIYEYSAYDGLTIAKVNATEWGQKLTV